MSDPWRILLVDNNPDDRVSIMRKLRKQFAGMQIEPVTGAQDLARALETCTFDVVLTEYWLGWVDGLAVSQAVKARRPACPVIMFTRTGSEEIGVRAIKAGLDDYITKSPKQWARLLSAVEAALGQVRQRQAASERAARSRAGAKKKQTDPAMRTESFVAAVLDTIDALVVVLDQQGRIIGFNRACELVAGYAFHEVKDQFIWDVLSPDGVETVKAALADLRAGQLPSTYRNYWVAKDGSRRLIDWSNTALFNAQGTVEYIIATGIDITERQSAEQASRQAQAALHRRDAILEAVGVAAEQFLKLPAWEQHIRQVLERLGHATQASRVYVAHNHSGPDNALWVSRLYEWTAQGIAPQIDNLALQNLPSKQSAFARWEEVLSQEHIIHGPVKNFPERERVVLTQQDILSVVIVPIFVGKEWWGHIGLDDCAVEREWSAAEIDALRVAADILGATVQREQIEQEIRCRLREMALLNRVIASATATQDEKVVLQTACQELARTFNLPQCAAAMFGGSYVQATLMAEYIAPGRPSRLGSVITVTEDQAVKYALERKEPLAIVDALADPRLEAMHHSLLQRGTVSLMIVPILLRGDVVGMINLEADQWREFSEEEIALAQSVAAATGQAWENVRLYEAAYNRTRYLATLNEIGQAVTSTLDLDRVLVILLEHVRQATNAEACSVALVEESTGDLVFLHAAGGGGHEVIGMRLKPGQGIAGWVAANREPVLVLEATSDKRFYNNVDEKTGFTTHDLICVPLIARDTVIGVVELLNKREGAFGESDIRLLESVAAQAAIAIENARLFQKSQAFTNLLQTAAQVSRAASSILNLDQLLPQVVELIRGHFDLYYVGIFLVEESSKYAVLRVGTGEAGQQMLAAGHKLEVGGSSMIGWCVANAQGRIALDVGKEATRFDNPWLPETRSELALPLISRGQVIGAMTIQSAQATAFSDIHITTLQTMADQVSNAIENARSFENERRRSTELEILRQASLHVTSSLELEPVLEAILQYALDLVQADDSHVFLYDGERVTFGAAMWADNRQERLVAEPQPGSLTYTVAQSGERVVVPDVSQHPLFKNWQWGGAMVGLPLRVGDRVSGVMNIAFNKARIFNENELRILDLLSDQAAVAIQNARLYGETRRHLQELAIISEVALAGAAGRPFDETVARATAALSRLWTKASLGFLFVDESDMSLRTHSSYHGLPLEGTVMRAPLDEGLTGLAVRERRPVKIGDVTADPHYVGFVPGVRSEMAAPLVIGERVIGVVNVESFKPDAFSGDDLRLLATLAGQLATIFEKARLDAALAEHTELLERRVEERTAEIRSQQARTQAILDALGEGVVVTGVEGEILYINPALGTLMGYDAQETIGKNPRLWQSGQTPPEVYREMWATILMGTTWRGELVNKRKDGSLYTASVTIAPIPSAEPNQLAGFVGVQHDITRLKELDRLKSEFVSNVSHELRTPLSNIKLYLGLLEHGKLGSTRYLQYVDVLRREELRLERLIEDLLTLSRLELAKVEVQREVLDLDTLARQLVDDRQALAAARGLTLLYEAQPDPLPPVWVDGAMISQVLTNLMSNSMNYTPHGGTITVRPQAQLDESQSPGSWVMVAVQDTGAGISPQDQQHLFERFYRGQAARQTGSPGTGLGLAICQEIMNRHNGHITFESQLGQGSTFTVWLPAALGQQE